MKIRAAILGLTTAMIVSVAAVEAAPQNHYRMGGGEQNFHANPGDPLAGKLFPPEMIMRNRQELKLSEKQSSRLIELMQDFQSGIVETQWRLEETKEDLAKAIDVAPIETTTVGTVLDQLFKLENQIKRHHILLLVQMRNELSAEQVGLLAARRTGNYTRAPMPAMDLRR